MICAATAFHWIPEEYGYRRVHRLLKRGGAFARFAYHAGADELRPAMMQEIQLAYDCCPSLSGKAKPYGDMQAEELAQLAEQYGFVDTAYRIYRFKKDFTAEEYMRLLRTYPDHMALNHTDRTTLFDSIRRAIVRHGGVITVHYTADMQLACKA